MLDATAGDRGSAPHLQDWVAFPSLFESLNTGDSRVSNGVFPETTGEFEEARKNEIEAAKWSNASGVLTA
jgi:hypothetical protein